MIDSTSFFQKSLYSLSSSLNQIDANLTKEDKGTLESFGRKLSYPYQYFNSMDDYYQPIASLNKKHFISLLSNLEIEGSRNSFENVSIYIIKYGKESTLLFLKMHVSLLVDSFEKIQKPQLEIMELTHYALSAFLVFLGNMDWNILELS